MTPAGRRPTGATRGLRTQDLVDSCRKMATERVVDWSQKAALEVSDKLFDAADKAFSSQEQMRLITASGTLKSHADQLADALEQELRANFEHGMRRAAGHTDDDDADRELSLIAEEELSETLALSDLAARCEVRFTQELFALNARFAVLNGGRRMESDQNPIGPSQFAAAIRNSTQELELESEDRVALYEAYSSQLMAHLGKLYDALNEHLIEAGVLPNFKPTSERPADPREAPEVPPETSPEGPENPAEAASPDQSAAPTEARPRSADVTRSRELMTQIQRLMERASGPQTTLTGPAAQTGQLQDALARIEASPGAPLNARSLKRQLGQILKSQGVSVGHQHARTIDLMSMVHDYAEKELPTPESFQSLVSRLRMPLIKVALQDKGVFENPSHPARRFYETLSETGQLYMDDENVRGSTMERLKQAVTTVLEGFSGDIAVFDEALSDLDRHLKGMRHRASIAEKRHVAAEQGKAKLETARSKARVAIADVLERYQPPKYAQTLLEDAWADYLALIDVRNESDSKEWNSAVSAAQFIAMALSSKTSKVVAAKLSGKAKQAIAVLRKGLTQVGFANDEVHEIAERIADTLRWSANEHKTEDPVPEHLNQRCEPTRRHAQKKPKPETPAPEPVTELPADVRDEMARLQHVAYGSYFQIRRPDGHWIKRRLSWHNPVSGHCLFVNHLGQPSKMQMTQLAKLIVSGDARKIEVNEKPLFDRAMSAILGRLRRLIKPRAKVGGMKSAGEAASPAS